MINPLALIIDDDPDQAEMLALLARSSGFSTTVAHSAHQARWEIETSAPELIIADLKLPEISGLNLIQELRDKIGRQVFGLLLSAADEALSEIGELSADTYALAKSDLAKRSNNILKEIYEKLSKKQRIEFKTILP